MPSFDIVSEVPMHEVQNAVDNANRELMGRFDFRNVDATFTLVEKDKKIRLEADGDFQIQQMDDILRNKAAQRNTDTASLTFETPEQSGKRWSQDVKLKDGIDKDTAKKIVKMIKDGKFKVTTQIMDEVIRVTGKKKDDLQLVIAEVRKAELGQPFQFVNFRD